jgi:hypothetical protein
MPSGWNNSSLLTAHYSFKIGILFAKVMHLLEKTIIFAIIFMKN